MNRIVNFLCLGFFIALGAAPSSACAQPLLPAMDKAYESLKKLQPFLASGTRFDDAKNEAEVLALITALRDNFHGVSAFKTGFAKDPGFQANLAVIQDLLADAAQRFKEGKKPYALQRLRAVANNCSSCHTTYNVKLSFKTTDAPPAGLSNLEKSDFYTATRQFPKAKEALDAAIAEDRSSFTTMRALRKWLVIQVRVDGSPKDTLAGLERYQSTLELPNDDTEELRRWIAGTKRWQNAAPLKTLDEIDPVVRSSIGTEGRYSGSVEVVDLLRATAALHDLSVNPKLSAPDRAKTLLLLGISYDYMPLFFIDELPAIYFRRCIEENPGSDDAKRAYRFYKEKIVTDFSGSGGTHIPADIDAELAELYNKAYDIPRFDGKI